MEQICKPKLGFLDLLFNGMDFSCHAFRGVNWSDISTSIDLE